MIQRSTQGLHVKGRRIELHTFCCTTKLRRTNCLLRRKNRSLVGYDCSWTTHTLTVSIRNRASMASSRLTAARAATPARRPRRCLTEELVLGERVCGRYRTHFAQKIDEVLRLFRGSRSAAEATRCPGHWSRGIVNREHHSA
jgi:hypothetical protein